MGATIMLGTLFGLMALIIALVLRYDPEARRPPGHAATGLNNEGGIGNG